MPKPKPQPCRKPPPAPAPLRTPIADEIRAALTNDGRTPYEIAAAAGIDRSSLSRFLAGSRSLNLPTLEALAPVLNLRLVQVTASSTKPRRRR